MLLTSRSRSSASTTVGAAVTMMSTSTTTSQYTTPDQRDNGPLASCWRRFGSLIGRTRVSASRRATAGSRPARARARRGSPRAAAPGARGRRVPCRRTRARLAPWGRSDRRGRRRRSRWLSLPGGVVLVLSCRDTGPAVHPAGCTASHRVLLRSSGGALLSAVDDLEVAGLASAGQLADVRVPLVQRALAEDEPGRVLRDLVVERGHEDRSFLLLELGERPGRSDGLHLLGGHGGLPLLDLFAHHRGAQVERRTMRRHPDAVVEAVGRVERLGVVRGVDPALVDVADERAGAVGVLLEGRTLDAPLGELKTVVRVVEPVDELQRRHEVLAVCEVSIEHLPALEAASREDVSRRSRWDADVVDLEVGVAGFLEGRAVVEDRLVVRADRGGLARDELLDRRVILLRERLGVEQAIGDEPVEVGQELLVLVRRTGQHELRAVPPHALAEAPAR